ncbi:MAG: snoRNA-binding rRNA-processing protein [Alectoria fallacina]|uniref:SnoRNA-binding rRNA-processing protein n=1 Tax=Alectoria fallacina TaxID=1903189 RepID=A0A8H3FTD9_9LECA|nr:MAG: snoRNA-binding rRNA-processing protein [Alectoria fallacina]
MVPTSRSRSARRHAPLEEDLTATGPLRLRSKKRKARPEDDGNGYVDSRSSRKILKIGQDLADEEQQENVTAAPNPAFTFESRFGGASEPEEEDGRYEDGAWGDEEDDIVEEVEIDPNDLSLFDKFMPSTSADAILQATTNKGTEEGQGTNLADLILEKIAAHEATQTGHTRIQGGGPPEEAIELPAKVVEVYSKIGMILSRYKSGKLPKPFKIVPTLPQWEELLAITRPESWTPNACYEATKIFVSGNASIARLFLRNVLLERVREEIHESKKLNVHLYKALKKALYKPSAWFKGVLFPLLNEGQCTLREAQIISSVLARVSVPVLHSAAALLRLTEIAAEQTSSISTEAAGATNVFIRTLLEKKYALPYKVIDGLVFHFLRFRITAPANGRDAGFGATSLPVLWHQCLLVFAQRYRNDITEDQREALLDLLLVRGHKAIGPEVRRELLEGRGRGMPVEDLLNGENDDTMELT